MKFAENLYELRKQYGYSQEELAAVLQVSRQSVSKWENNTATPELDKLLQLCELFHCSLDELLKGDFKETYADQSVIEKQLKNEARLTASGCGMILLGLTISLGFDHYITNESKETIMNAVFLFFVLVGVLCFVISGMKHDYFMKHYPNSERVLLHEEYEIKRFEKQHQLSVVTGIALIFIAVIMQQLLEPHNEDIANAVFMLIITVAVVDFVYFGMKQRIYETPAKKKLSEKEAKTNMYCGIIMLFATGVYFIWSYLFKAWEYAWIVFVIGGILCFIVMLIMNYYHPSED